MKIVFEKPKSCTERFKEGASIDDGLSGSMEMRMPYKHVNTYETNTRQDKPEGVIYGYSHFGKE